MHYELPVVAKLASGKIYKLCEFIDMAHDIKCLNLLFIIDLFGGGADYHHSIHVEVIGQLYGIDFLFLPFCGLGRQSKHLPLVSQPASPGMNHFAHN